MKITTKDTSKPCPVNFVSTKLDNGTTMHVLKCIEPYYYDLWIGTKTFELRKDDREFEYMSGDSLVLYQVKNGLLTGEYIIKKVTYVLKLADDFGLKPGYCIMSIK